MRKKISTATAAVADIVVGAQGVAGVACLAVGAYLVASLGVALLVVGVFLLVGAWATR